MTGEVVLKGAAMATYLYQDMHVDLHRCQGWQVADLFAMVTVTFTDAQIRQVIAEI